jgi:hypothetical protein
VTAGATRQCPCNCHRPIRVGLLVCTDGWGRLPVPLRRRVAATQNARYADRPGDPMAKVANRKAIRDAKAWMRRHPMPHRVLTLAELADVPCGAS